MSASDEYSSELLAADEPATMAKIKKPAATSVEKPSFIQVPPMNMFL